MDTKTKTQTKQQGAVILFGARNTVNSLNEIKYYVYYVGNGIIKEVNLNTFIRIKGQVFILRSGRIKVVVMGGVSRSLTLSNLKQVFPQAIFEPIAEAWHNLKGVCNLLGDINKTLIKVKDKCSGFDFSVIVDFIQLVGDVFSDTKTLTPWRFFSLIIDMHKILVKLGVSFNINTEVVRTSPHSGWEPLAFSAILQFLPVELITMIKGCSFFTNSKFCDDPSVLWNVFDILIKVFNYFIELIPTSIPGYYIICKLKEFIQSISYRNILSKVVELIGKWEMDKKIVLQNTFREQVITLQGDIKKNITLQEMRNKSQYFRNVLLDFDRIIKSIRSFESTVRREPVCFIFEGPPGCLKSVTMAKLVQCLRMDTYTHIVKGTNDGKDFYDCYNGQKVFVMDDVGQQSISQWRNIINIVSPIKMPLECAAADLKDTKYFDSDIVMLTTNNFMNITGLLRDDGISDIKALWRRGYVFDFSEARNEMGKVVGSICFKHYSLSERKFVAGFPMDIGNYLKANSIDINAECIINSADSCVKYLGWMKQIVCVFDTVRNTQFASNVLTDFEMEQLDNIHVNDSYISNFGNIISKIYQDYFKDIIGDLQGLFTDLLLSDPLVVSFDKVKYFLIAAVSVVCVTGFIGWCVQGTSYDPPPQVLSISQMFSKIDKKRSIAYKQSTAVEKIQSQVYEISVQQEDRQFMVCGMVSGHYLITVSHAVPLAEMQITIYKDRDKNDILLDHILMKVVYRNNSNDVVILEMNPKILSPFKSLAKFFSNDQKGDKWMITPCGPIYLPPHFKASTCDTYYQMPVTGDLVYLRCRNPSVFDDSCPEALTYDFGTPGLCASPIVTTNGHFLGFHVSGDETLTECHALLWSEEVKENIKKILVGDVKYLLDVDISQKVRGNRSGIKLELDAHIQTPKESNFGPSPLYGVFPVSREPVNLQHSGVHTVKDVEGKSMIPVKPVGSGELEFAAQVIEDFFEDFTDLSEGEIVGGNEMLAGLNKKSSNGFNCEDDKKVYINFNDKNYTPKFVEELNCLEDKLKTGLDIKPEDVMWYATLKDELRSIEKGGKPRSFRVSRLHVQVLTKKYFGNLVAYLIKNRSFNQIMVGVNPFKEFKLMYEKLKMCTGIWAGDIGSYDGSMLPQVQSLVNKLVLSHYKGDNKDAAEFILTSMPYCLLGINDDVFITNHSMPSGSFLTAIMNSLVNRAYTAMWLYRNTPELNNQQRKQLYHHGLIDFVYGDDKLNGILKPHANLNAITMKDFFTNVGMTFTDSLKQPIVTPYQTLHDVTFLKRYFRYHPTLQEITCPLDVSTLYSTLSWLDYSKETINVMQDKINNFQREIFLHWNLFEQDKKHLFEECKSRKIEVTELPLKYLVTLYKEDPDAYFAFYMDKFKYV
jgi:hypothetical protein